MEGKARDERRLPVIIPAARRTWGCSMYVSEAVPNDGAIRLAPLDLILQVFGEVDRSCGGGGMADAQD